MMGTSSRKWPDDHLLTVAPLCFTALETPATSNAVKNT